MLRTASILTMVLAARLVCGEEGDAIVFSIEPVGGSCRMFVRPVPSAVGAPLKPASLDPVTLRVTLKSNGAPRQAKVVLWAEETFGKKLEWRSEFTVDLGAEAVAKDIVFDVTPGYFKIIAEVTSGDFKLSKWTDVGIIPPPHRGIRKESFFASNAPRFDSPENIAFFRDVGMKVARMNWLPQVKNKDWRKNPPLNVPLDLDFATQDKKFAVVKEHDLWPLPIIGCALVGDGGLAVSDLAHKCNQMGPPRDNAEFLIGCEQILRHYPELTTWEFWNEPWIFAWEWAATPAEYRTLQKQWSEMALKVNPQMRIVAGNSASFAQDHIEHEPSCWKGLLSAVSNHPYTGGTADPSYRRGDNFRATDFGFQVSRRMGLPYYYITEGGTEFRAEFPELEKLRRINREINDLRDKLEAMAPKERYQPDGMAARSRIKELTRAAEELPLRGNNLNNAIKIVQLFVKYALHGAYQGNAQWLIGYGPRWTCSNTSLAVMTQLLEDRPIVAEIWPEHALLNGAIFANPKFVTPEVKALPRAAEINARWQVPIPEERANDQTKVAVIWNMAGADIEHLDADGSLTLNDRKDIRAFDLTGREIAQDPNAKSLRVPFGNAPVYLLSDALSVVELRELVASATIREMTPVNLYALSLARPGSEAQKLSVRIENQMNRTVAGKLTLATGGSVEGPAVEFTIPPAKLIEVQVPWPAQKVSASNQYPVTLTAECEAIEGSGRRKLPASIRKQLVQTARFVKRTVQVDGSMDDWKDVVPVMLDSDAMQRGQDVTQYFLNPNLQQPTGTAEKPRLIAQVYTAYDDENVYVAAAIQEPSYLCQVGQPAKRGKQELPYKSGHHDGLDHIFNGNIDALGLAFGFRERVPGLGRQMDDPYAWKGHFYDTDYNFVAHSSIDGEMLVRIWGPETSRRDAYQTEKVPGVGPVAGSRIKIVRNEEKKLTVYEMAIPRSELKLFDPAQPRCRFSFAVHNNEKLGFNQSTCNWADAAGVFDHWQSCGSFAPNWSQFTACQSFFGIDR